MGAEPHGQLFVSQNNYLSFRAENYAYAIAVEHIKKIAAMGEGTPYVIPPQAPEHVKCMVNLEGKFLTVIELVKTSNDVLKGRNQIIVLDYMDQDIGILAKNIRLVNISASEISVNRKKFVYDEKGEIYIVFDISQCGEYADACGRLMEQGYDNQKNNTGIF